MGPLEGIVVIEVASIGPAPFAGMMLADHGARVIRIARPRAAGDPRDPLLRSRETVELDLKAPAGVEKFRSLVRTADALIEGFRPGVMERLGLGPDVLLADNPSLVYGRMTGWGQDGPLARAAGHDINYIALAGTLGAMGRAGEAPVPPINLVGDFGGGGMMLAFGMVSAVLAGRTGGRGQVVDCAMVDGAALLMSMVWGFRAMGQWREERGTNLLNTGAPYYDVYETADGAHLAVGAIEPQFHAELLLGLETESDGPLAEQTDQGAWPSQKRMMADIIRGRTRAEWRTRYDGTDACVTPVLGFDEAVAHPHNAHRGTFVEVAGVTQPAPAPRYSATPCAPPRSPTALALTS